MQRSPRGRDYLVLGWIALVHLVVNAIWIHHDQICIDRVPDQLLHYVSVCHMLTGLELGGVAALGRYLHETIGLYPAIGHLPNALVGLVAGGAPDVLRLSNVVFFVPLLLGVYGVGRQCHGRGAGLLAAALVSLMPAVYGGWRTISLDFRALCLTPLAVYYLLRAERFGRRRESVLFGLWAGVAALAKGQALLFILWPALLEWVRGLVPRRQRVSALLNAALALVTLLAVTSPWWGGHIGRLVSGMLAHSSGEGMEMLEGDISLWGGITFYLRTFPLLVTGPLALALVGAVVILLRGAVWKRGAHPTERSARPRVRSTLHSRMAPPLRARNVAVLLLWLLAPLALHMVLAVRNQRYLFPLVPAAPLVLAVALFKLPGRARAVGVATAAGLGVVLWIGGSFAPARSWIGCRPASAAGYLVASGDCSYTGPPARARDADRQVASTLLHALRRYASRRMLIYVNEGMSEWVPLIQRQLPRARFYVAQSIFEYCMPRYAPRPDWDVFLVTGDRTGGVPPCRGVGTCSPLARIDTTPLQLPQGVVQLWKVPAGYEGLDRCE